jgi:DNA polymerase I
MKTNIILDGKFFIYRALSTNFDLSFNDLNTTIYYNFLSSIKMLCKKFKPDNIIIMWDSEYSKRREFYSKYKTHRNVNKNIEKQRIIIKKEYNNIKKVFKNLGFISYLRYGLESDDLFYYYAEQYPNNTIIIVSRDEDLYQLLTFKNVKLYNPHLKQFIDRKYITTKYDITPEQWYLYKAINGCSSDTVPGIPSIGEKSTIQFITNQASEKIKQKIKENWIIVERNKRLVKLPYISIDKIKPLRYKQTKFNFEYFADLCFTLGFKSFLDNMNEWKEIFSFKE